VSFKIPVLIKYCSSDFCYWFLIFRKAWHKKSIKNLWNEPQRGYNIPNYLMRLARQGLSIGPFSLMVLRRRSLCYLHPSRAQGVERCNARDQLLTSGFHLTGLLKHVTTSSHVSKVAGHHRQDSNLGVRTCESGVVTTRPRAIMGESCISGLATLYRCTAIVPRHWRLGLNKKIKVDLTVKANGRIDSQRLQFACAIPVLWM
jgi:hypothetical protein